MFYAHFAENRKKYTVTYLDVDGSVWDSVTDVAHGSTLPLPETAPEQIPEADAHYCFVQWEGAGEPVTGNMTVKPVFRKEPHSGGSAQCTGQAVCQTCQVAYGPVMEAVGHEYTQSVVPPTCTTNGYTLHICMRCADQYQDTPVPSTGHSYGEWVEVKAPGCTTAGTQKQTCACGHHQTRPVAALGHVYVTTVVPPTEASVGYTQHTCSRCQDSYRDSEVPALGPYEITSQELDIQDGWVQGIALGTTVQELVKELDQGAYCKFYQDGREVTGKTLIGTGMELKLVVGNKVRQTLTVIVAGDTNGDGILSITDMLALKLHLLDKGSLTQAGALAADTSADGEISITDFLQMKLHLLGRELVVPRNMQE